LPVLAGAVLYVMPFVDYDQDVLEGCQVLTERPYKRGMSAQDNPVHRVRGGWPGQETEQTGGAPL